MQPSGGGPGDFRQPRLDIEVDIFQSPLEDEFALGDFPADGVEPLEDMLPETAFVKMMWSLGNTNTAENAKRLLKTNVAGEYNPRTPYARREK